jgi:hypothetical protein
MKTRVFTNNALGLQVSNNLFPSALQLATNTLLAMADHFSVREQSIRIVVT